MLIGVIKVQKRATEIPKDRKEGVSRTRRRWHLNQALKGTRNTKRDWRGIQGLESP